MIIKVNSDNKIDVVFTDKSAEWEEAFIERNQNLGFMQIESTDLPVNPNSEIAQYATNGGFYKWDGSQIVVDDEENAKHAQKVINQEAREYLAATDWYEIRSINGVPVPSEIAQKRQEARDSVVDITE